MGLGALCQAADPGTSAQCQLSSCLSALLGASVLLRGGGRGWTPPFCLGDVLGRASWASGRRVQKVQASVRWVTSALH